MRTKTIGILLAVIMTAAAAIAMTGCMAPSVAKYFDSGRWKIDFQASSPECAEIFDDLTLDVYSDSVYIDFDYAEGFQTSPNTPESGLYVLFYNRADENSADVNWDISYETKGADGISSYITLATLTGRNDGKLGLDALNIPVAEDDYHTIYTIDCVLTKSDEPSRPKPEPEPGPDDPANPKPEPEPGPDDPAITGETRFEETKSAYAEAGYDADVALGELDPTLQAAAETLKETYAALGYEMSFIGKNLDNPLAMELYMLIKANDKAGADEIAEEFESVYSCEKDGRDVIIKISLLGEANFEPFRQAHA